MTFPTTHWTLLAAATLNGDTRGRSALEEMCREYHRPVFVVLRARGFDESEAEDLTQDFFLKLFEAQVWKRADREKGRFRTFLLTVLFNMVDHIRRAQTAQKRGGGMVAASLESLAEEGVEVPEPDVDTAKLFDREWAIKMLQSAFARIESEFEAAGKKAEFSVLRRFLPGVEAPLKYDEAAALMSKPEGSVKAEVSRLRDRFREALRANVARTVTAAHEVDEELRHLYAVLR